MATVTPQQARNNAAASYLNLIASWQIQITPEVKAFVAKAVQQNMNSSAFLAAVRKTKFYALRFPGIMKKGGVMRMTESQYISGYQSARDYAASLGRGLTQQAYGLAIKNGNSPAEIRTKLEVNDKLRTYRPLFNQFNDYLMATGQIKKPLTIKEERDFVLGQAPKQLEEAWQSAYVATKLADQGFDVGKPREGGDISYKNLNKALDHFTALGGNVESIDFSKLASMASQALPASRLYGLGVKKSDLVEMALGGKRAPQIAAKVQQALATAEAFATETRANPSLTQRGMPGTPGAERIQATE